MPIAFIDSYSGISGESALAALLDAGLSIDDLRIELQLVDLHGYEISIAPETRHHSPGSQLVVTIGPETEQPSWTLPRIEHVIDSSKLSSTSRERALRTIARLAEVRHRVQGSSLANVSIDVHDLVLILGFAIGSDLLGLEEFYAGTVTVGTSTIDGVDGPQPAPSPIVSELFTMARMPIQHTDSQASTVTPTGAAILSALANFKRPAFQTSSVGYGFSPEQHGSGAVRIWLGDLVVDAPEDDSATEMHDDLMPTEILLETNIDNMNPEFYEPVIELLVQEGALDVHLTSIIGQRGQPAVRLSVLCRFGDRRAMEYLLVEHTNCLDICMIPLDRTSVEQRTQPVTTRWGDVRVTLRIWNERVIDVAPVYSDCYAIVQEHRVPIRLVYGEAFRLAEVFIGQQTREGNQWRGWRL